MQSRFARDPDWLRAVSLALALHAVIAAALFVGFRFTRPTQPVHGPLKATVMRDAPVERAEKEKAKQEEERQKREQEKQRAAEEEKRKEAERLRLEAEQKKQQEAERKKKEEAQRKKEETERKQKADAEKRKQDAERKKVDQERRKQAEQSLREQLAEEEKGRASARNARLASDLDKYKAAIAQRVSRNWVRPPSSRKDLQCTVNVRQAPGGEVLEAKVVRSSGDTAFDRSVESAVYKASPLPAPTNPEVFDRDIEFIFRPE